MNYEKISDEENSPLSYVLMFLAILGIGFLMGLTASDDGERVRKEAVKAGAAFYWSNTNTGEAVFTWKTGCE